MKKLPILYIVILVMGVIILLQTCNSGCGKPNVVYKDTGSVKLVVRENIIRDTAFLPGKKNPEKVRVDTLWDTIPLYKPDTSYPKLYNQYKSLGLKYFTIRYYSDTISLENSKGLNIGYIVFNDTVSQNKRVGSGYLRNVSWKDTTKIVTLEEKRRKLYLGAGLYGSKQDVLNGATLGILYQDRKDDIYQGTFMKSFNGLPNYYGVSYYKKISLRKKK